MNTHSLVKNGLNAVQLVLQVNFNASVIFLLIASILTITGSELFIASDQDLYGPLVNNMRFVLFYLCLMQIAVYGFYRVKKNHAVVLLLGVFFLFLIASLEFYCVINQIEVDGNYQLIFLYAGLSHAFYGGFGVIRRPVKVIKSTINDPHAAKS